MKTLPTVREVRETRKAKNEARKAYFSAFAIWNQTPDRLESDKAFAWADLEKATAAYHKAQEAWDSLIRRSNSYASQFAPRAK